MASANTALPQSTHQQGNTQAVQQQRQQQQEAIQSNTRESMSTAEEQQPQPVASRPTAYATGIASVPPTLPPSTSLLSPQPASSTHRASDADGLLGSLGSTAAGYQPYGASHQQQQQQQQLYSALQQQQQQQQQRRREQQGLGLNPAWPSQLSMAGQYGANSGQIRHMSASVPAAANPGLASHFGGSLFSHDAAAPAGFSKEQGTYQPFGVMGNTSYGLPDHNIKQGL